MRLVSFSVVVRVLSSNVISATVFETRDSGHSLSIRFVLNFFITAVL